MDRGAGNRQPDFIEVRLPKPYIDPRGA